MRTVVCGLRLVEAHFRRWLRLRGGAKRGNRYNAISTQGHRNIRYLWVLVRRDAQHSPVAPSCATEVMGQKMDGTTYTVTIIITSPYTNSR